MTRFRLIAALALLPVLAVPAVVLAAVKRGTYIEVKTSTQIVTNAAATKIKSLNVPCIRNGQQSGGNLITKSLPITDGKFSFSGKSTLHSLSNSVIDIKVTGKYSSSTGKFKGEISYPNPAVGCTARSYSAKYYGVNPQG